MTSYEWLDKAACRDVDTELFFPIGKNGTGEPTLRQVAAAKKICEGCVVRSECLEWAVETRNIDGIFGGLTGGERRDLLRSRAAGSSLERIP